MVRVWTYWPPSRTLVLVWVLCGGFWNAWGCTVGRVNPTLLRRMKSRCSTVPLIASFSLVMIRENDLVQMWNFHEITCWFHENMWTLSWKNMKPSRHYMIFSLPPSPLLFLFASRMLRYICCCKRPLGVNPGSCVVVEGSTNSSSVSIRPVID